MRADTEQLDRLAAWIDGATLILSTTVLFLLGCWLVSRATRRTARVRPGLAALLRIVSAPALAVGALALAYLVPVPTEAGSWVCERCREGSRELRYLDLTVRTTSEVPAVCAAPVEEDAGSGHVWAPVGCHSHGRDSRGTTSVACHYPSF
jgi:hypothetical protein